MVLKDGYTDVPTGKIAAVVAHLEMLAPPRPRPTPQLDGVTIHAVATPSVAWYRDIYRRIGASDWLWFSRLQLTTAALEAIIRDPRVEIHALEADGCDEGLLELDFRTDGQCELAFFGVTRGLIGKGAGRLLMNTAITRVRSRPIRRFCVHTCTLDHPGTISFYIRTGFVPCRQQIEITDDPRLSGLIPDTAAPHVPIIRPRIK